MVVVGLVAVPARREGRDLLTPKGEQVADPVLRQARHRRRVATRLDADPADRRPASAA